MLGKICIMVVVICVTAALNVSFVLLEMDDHDGISGLAVLFNTAIETMLLLYFLKQKGWI